MKNPVQAASRPIVCDLCGGDPVCIDRCPTRALSFEDSKEVVVLPEDALKELLERWGIDG
jgi:Fe-S-cluster-containing hydrogenase component 2